MLCIGRRLFVKKPKESDIIVETPRGEITFRVFNYERGIIRVGIDCPQAYTIRRGELAKRETVSP